jgi:hypothetical protein
MHPGTKVHIAKKQTNNANKSEKFGRNSFLFKNKQKSGKFLKMTQNLEKVLN